MPLVFMRYSGNPPSNQQLRRVISHANTPDFICVVATRALERVRGLLAPPSQVDEGGEKHLVFHQFVRHLMPKNLLTRTEDAILLQRAAHAVATENAQLKRQLVHDVGAWRDAIAMLDEWGLDATDASVRDALVLENLSVLLEKLQDAHRTQRKGSNRRPFESAARKFLTEDFEAPSTVIMEGFSRLTRLQSAFLKQCLEGGSTVYVVQPELARQAFAAKALVDTFSPHLELATTEHIETPQGEDGDLGHLKRELFANELTPSPPTLDGSVSLQAHAHPRQEVEQCLSTIAKLLDNNQLTRREIAIVVRDRERYLPMLIEEARLQGLEDAFFVPHRRLLLTPLGRFVLELYNIWQDGVLEMNADQFETILASGWLGFTEQQSLDAFESVRFQIFERCLNHDSWVQSLTTLETLLANPKVLKVTPRMAIHSATREQIDGWRKSVALLCKMARSIRSVNTSSVYRMNLRSSTQGPFEKLKTRSSNRSRTHLSCSLRKDPSR